MKTLILKLTPEPIRNAYYLLWAYLGVVVYRFPSRQLFVVGVTGTKGKSTVAELIRTLLVGCGYKVALASTIHFRIGDDIEPNLYKMTMPGRGRLQRFMRKALDAGCTHVVLEMTSEGARQFRHIGIDLDALVFTNLSPEHIESHGSMERYAAAKLSLARHLEESPKRPRYIIANADDPYGKEFLKTKVEVRAPFSLKSAEPYSADERSVRFVWEGTLFGVPLPGLFNLKNALAALAFGEAIGLSREKMKKSLERVQPIAGRAQRIEKGQPFAVVIDYAHTPDSLRALYETYANKRIIGVLGSTGGGRDKWKRPEMGALADEFCTTAILTNEDPYNEDPKAVIDDVAKGFKKKKPYIILERRRAIREALREAKKGDVVLITGKGTDPYIMGKHGSREPWSDTRVATEELEKLGYN